MVELKFAKDKKALLQFALIGLIYLAAAVSFLVILRPRIGEVHRLQSVIAQEENQVQLMERVVQRRSQIEAGIKEQAQAVKAFENVIPTADNFPEILAAINELTSSYRVELINLNYLPVQTENLDAWYSMSLTIAGSYGDVYKAIEALTAAFPSLSIRSLTAVSSINEQVFLETDFNLYIVPVAWASKGSWQRPVWQETNSEIAGAFGVPLQYIEELFANSLKLIGIVRVHGGEHRALVSFNGTQEWKKIGDSLGIGTIMEIHESELVLDVHGVRLSINMGGNRGEG